MQIGERLQTVAALVPPNTRVADIGSDHAYLAMYLWQRGDIDCVIATDKNEGPCHAARKLLAAADLSDAIPVRCGDGLAPLRTGEVDVVCVAGMGGELIASILQNAPQIFACLQRVVLQPMNDVSFVRTWLYAHHWHIVEERLVTESGRLYVVLAAEPGDVPMPDEIALMVGPCLLQGTSPLFTQHLQDIVSRARRAASGMARSESAKKSEKYRQLLDQIARLEAIHR